MNELLKESKLNARQMLVSVNKVLRAQAVAHTQSEYERFAVRPVAPEAEGDAYAIRMWSVGSTEKCAFTRLGNVVTWLTKTPGARDAS
jgi:hypothetical protein